MTTSPPDPPSPPTGPPFGTWPSRRNDTEPAPPSPPRRLTWTRSTNDDMCSAYGRRGDAPVDLLGRRDDVDELAALAVAELHDAVRGREEGVVASLADVVAGV